MPETIRKLSSGRYRVSTPGGVKTKHTTKEKAQAQARLLRAVDHGWKPTGESLVLSHAAKLVACVIEAARQKTVLARSGQDFGRAKYGNLASPALAAYLRRHAKYQYEPEYVEQALRVTAQQLLSDTGSVGLTGGGYAYYPINAALTRWATSDGGEIKADLLSIMLEYVGYGERGVSDVMDAALSAAYSGDSAELESHLIRKKVRQDDYEAGAMQGDWH